MGPYTYPYLGHKNPKKLSGTKIWAIGTNIWSIGTNIEAIGTNIGVMGTLRNQYWGPEEK